MMKSESQNAIYEARFFEGKIGDWMRFADACNALVENGHIALINKREQKKEQVSRERLFQGALAHCDGVLHLALMAANAIKIDDAPLTRERATALRADNGIVMRLNATTRTRGLGTFFPMAAGVKLPDNAALKHFKILKTAKLANPAMKRRTKEKNWVLRVLVADKENPLRECKVYVPVDTWRLKDGKFNRGAFFRAFVIENANGNFEVVKNTLLKEEYEESASQYENFWDDVLNR